MGSIQLGGTRFVVYSNDRPPRHLHSFRGGTEIGVDLVLDGNVALADRNDAVRPALIDRK